MWFWVCIAASRWSEYVSLFQSQMFVHVSSIDLLVLSLFVRGPLLQSHDNKISYASRSSRCLPHTFFMYASNTLFSFDLICRWWTHYGRIWSVVGGRQTLPSSWHLQECLCSAHASTWR